MRMTSHTQEENITQLEASSAGANVNSVYCSFRVDLWRWLQLSYEIWTCFHILILLLVQRFEQRKILKNIFALEWNMLWEMSLLYYHLLDEQRSVGLLAGLLDSICWLVNNDFSYMTLFFYCYLYLVLFVGVICRCFQSCKRFFLFIDRRCVFCVGYLCFIFVCQCVQFCDVSRLLTVCRCVTFCAAFTPNGRQAHRLLPDGLIAPAARQSIIPSPCWPITLLCHPPPVDIICWTIIMLRRCSINPLHHDPVLDYTVTH